MQAIAAYDAAVAAYRQTVLAAFQQVEDALAQTRILAQQIAEQQRRAVARAERAFELEHARYETGIDRTSTCAGADAAARRRARPWSACRSST